MPRIKASFQNQQGETLFALSETPEGTHLPMPYLRIVSLVDDTVSINEVAKIYTAERHSKSSISLDNADHLLSRKHDSEYVADVITSRAGRYLEINKVNDERSSGTALA